eukprot:GHVN01072157.1.p1 GENE.GHVN01072157.1~~GHVN01072157.1.p1  ORF type:complete len:528 (+),score=44.74 GHVN01072157.1:87-1670(+)
MLTLIILIVPLAPLFLPKFPHVSSNESCFKDGGNPDVCVHHTDPFSFLQTKRSPPWIQRTQQCPHLGWPSVAIERASVGSLQWTFPPDELQAKYGEARASPFPSLDPIRRIVVENTRQYGQHNVVPAFRSPQALNLFCGGFRSGGDDAYFINSSHGTFGVADGTYGSWQITDELMRRAHGVRALEVRSKIKRQLLMGGNIREDDSKDRIDDRLVCDGNYARCLLGLTLKKSITTVGAFQRPPQGAAVSLLMGMVDRSKTLHVANVGSSNFMVFRRTEQTGYQRSLVATSKSDQGFGFQMGRRNPSLKWDPMTADVYELPVQEGDLIIAGTKGLFDNIYTEELTTLLGRTVSPVESEVLDNIIAGGRRVHHLENLAEGIPRTSSKSLRFTTNPEELAQALTSVGTWFAFFDPRDGPFGTASRHESQIGDGPVPQNVDDLTIATCWVTRSSQFTKLRRMGVAQPYHYPSTRRTERGVARQEQILRSVRAQQTEGSEDIRQDRFELKPNTQFYLPGEHRFHRWERPAQRP